MQSLIGTLSPLFTHTGGVVINYYSNYTKQNLTSMGIMLLSRIRVSPNLNCENDLITQLDILLLHRFMWVSHNYFKVTASLHLNYDLKYMPLIGRSFNKAVD